VANRGQTELSLTTIPGSEIRVRTVDGSVCPRPSVWRRKATPLPNSGFPQN